MTKYDMVCRDCRHEWYFEMKISEYSLLQPDSEEWVCPKCQIVNNKNDRVLSSKIGKIVLGTSKGYFNSGG